MYIFHHTTQERKENKDTFHDDKKVREKKRDMLAYAQLVTSS